MSENINTETPETTSEATEAPSFKPIESQEELDQVISKRLARERKKFSDYEDLKAKAEKLNEIEQANLTDTEKAVAEAVSAKEAELTSFYAEKLASTEVKAKATELGFNDPQDVLTFVKVSDFLAENGLDQEALNDALTDLANRKPYLLATPSTPEHDAPAPRRIASQGTPVKPEGSDFESKLKALLTQR